MNIDELDRQIRSCRRCTAQLSKRPIDPPSDTEKVVPRPILSAPKKAPIMLIGQAPGLNEFRTGMPFTGDAGRRIRAYFARCALPETQFDKLVYQTSATKCFPGRKITGKGRAEDYVPTLGERSLCRPYLDAQIEAVSPVLIVTMGAMALAEIDKLRGKGTRKLEDAVGHGESWNERVVIALAHTSGTARWLNDPANKRLQECAQAILRAGVIAILKSH